MSDYMFNGVCMDREIENAMNGYTREVVTIRETSPNPYNTWEILSERGGGNASPFDHMNQYVQVRIANNGSNVYWRNVHPTR